MSSLLSPSGVNALDRLQARSLGVGVMAAVVCMVGAFISPGPFFRAYLTAYLFFLGIGLGSLAILMIYHITGGAWGFMICRTLEASSRTLPLLAILFLPIALGLRQLYPWARPELVAGDENLEHKQIYLNPLFFCIRAVFYFVVWSALAYLFSSWSQKHDRTDEAGFDKKMTRLAGPGLIIYGLTVTLASVDWLMSLQPAFRSTIFGPLFASGQIVSAHAFAIMALAWVTTSIPHETSVSRDVLNDLGNLLLTFLIIWAYMVFFQFMLMWIANLPYEIIWLLPRSQGVWLPITWAIIVFHLVIPFFLLLMRNIKRDSSSLAKVAGLILFMQLVFMYYQVTPAFGDTSVTEHWIGLFTPVAVGGVWLAYFLWELKRVPLFPVHDANRGFAIHLRQIDNKEKPREMERIMPEEAPVANGQTEHPLVRYERSDASFVAIMKVGAWTAGIGVIVFVVIWWFFDFYRNHQSEVKKSPFPLAPIPSTALPPEPRLEQLDRMNALGIQKDNKKEAMKWKDLNSYGPSSDSGFIHIPIDQAMNLLADKLPTRPLSSDEDQAVLEKPLNSGESNSGRMIRRPPR